MAGEAISKATTATTLTTRMPIQIPSNPSAAMVSKPGCYGSTTMLPRRCPPSLVCTVGIVIGDRYAATVRAWES